MNKVKCAALNFTFHSTYLDHLAPLCFIMKMPILLTEENQKKQMSKYYPQVEYEFFSKYTDIDYYELAKKYDMIFQTNMWGEEPIKLFAESLNKKIKLVYLPHGNSDKGHRKEFFLRGLFKQDIVLLYGDHIIDRIKRLKLWEKCPSWARIGNYRLQFYHLFKSFYDDIVKKEVFDNFQKKQRTVLYAPSWLDPEGSTSFFKMAKKIAEQIPDDFNFILKCHPLLEERHPQLYYSVIDYFKNRKNVIILTDFPLIYPLLAKTDIFLGDFSSVGYDFLSFGGPMFFFDILGQKNSDDPSHQLHRVGKQIPVNYYDRIFEYINNHWDEKLLEHQKSLYDFTFGREIPFDKLRKEIITTYYKN